MTKKLRYCDIINPFIYKLKASSEYIKNVKYHSLLLEEDICIVKIILKDGYVFKLTDNKYSNMTLFNFNIYSDISEMKSIDSRDIKKIKYTICDLDDKNTTCVSRDSSLYDYTGDNSDINTYIECKE